MEATSPATRAAASPPRTGSAVPNPAFAQDDGLWRRELLTDLAAAIAPHNAGNPRSGWFVRPAILRRVASVLGRRVAIETDRIVAAGDFAESLGTAVALETGLPFSAIDAAARPRLGVLHPGERVTIVSSHATGLQLIEALASRGIKVLGWHALVADAHGSGIDSRFSFEFSEDELSAAARAEGR